ncbi:hypothetical protein [Candidatus Soleaferrea massiliensis]|uniref:hypothetical protein n=1 Tax=Candidatus Soleaferrea massiliensis TaxID=1470354 RepID=UPI0012E072BE|nr:hypothetical protein [Candidatus Soleaferrea massiliensis]
MSSEQIMAISMLVIGAALVIGGVISGIIKYRKHKKETMSGAFYNKNIPVSKKFK